MAGNEADARMEWGACWLEPAPVPPAIAADVKKAMGGFLPAWATHLTSVPWLVRAFARVAERRLAHMPLALVDPIVLVVSQDNSCRYCFGATRALLKVQGYDDATIGHLERDLHLADVSPAEVAALQFARKVSQSNPRPSAADLAGLARAGFSPEAVAEIAYVASFAGLHNRVATFFALPPERMEGWVDHPLVRLIRPLLARMLRGKHQPAVPLPSPNEGPYAEVIAALDGSPAAHDLRNMVDAAMASPILPRRTKLLVFAVIGRALGCNRTVDEARHGLGADGFLPEEVDAILANLGSPRLDVREALLLPWARETVRYRPLAIMERTRQLARHMDVPEVIEAVGVAGLANSMARLSVLLETC